MFAGLFVKLLGVPILGRILGWGKDKAVPYVKGNARLLTSYLLLALVIAIGALAVTMWFQSKNLDRKLDDARTHITELTTKVQAVEQINAQQEDQISNLKKLRELDAKALAGLNEDNEALARRDELVKRQLADLERKNAQVREYLDRPLPAELRQLLNGPAASRTGNPGRNQN